MPMKVHLYKLLLIGFTFWMVACQEEDIENIIPTYLSANVGEDRFLMQGTRPNASIVGTVLTISGASTNSILNGTTNFINITIQGYNGPGRYNAGASLSGPFSECTYNVGTSLNLDSAYTTVENPIGGGQDSGNVDRGFVEIESEEGNIIRGNFQFTVTNPSNQTLVITNGTFEANG